MDMCQYYLFSTTHIKVYDNSSTKVIDRMETVLTTLSEYIETAGSISSVLGLCVTVVIYFSLARIRRFYIYTARVPDLGFPLKPGHFLASFRVERREYAGPWITRRLGCPGLNGKPRS